MATCAARRRTAAPWIRGAVRGGGHGDWAAIGAEVDLDQPRRPDLDPVLHRRAAAAARRLRSACSSARRASSPPVQRAGRRPVIFLSANGSPGCASAPGSLTWPPATGRVLGIRYAAAYGNQILIAGDVAPAAGQHLRHVSAAWLSSNGGTGLDAGRPAGRPGRARRPGPDQRPRPSPRTGSSCRPATAAGRPRWTRTVRRTAPPGRSKPPWARRPGSWPPWPRHGGTPRPANGPAGGANGPAGGAVITGQEGPAQALIAFTSADGASWRRNRGVRQRRGAGRVGRGHGGGRHRGHRGHHHRRPRQPPAAAHRARAAGPPARHRHSQDPRRHRSPTRRQRHRGGQRRAGGGGQRQRLSRGLDLDGRRQLLDPGQAARPRPCWTGPGSSS